jgi:hypothetical protein
VQKKVSRYIPVKKRVAVVKRYNGHCAVFGCNKKADHIHHQEKFAKVKNHNKLVPLCKVHHELVHNNLYANQAHDPANWEFQLRHTDCAIDKKYQKLRC